MHRTVHLLREFSIPLILGVLTALVWANIDLNGYNEIIYYKLFGTIDLHFIANDIIMVFFFGIAAVEITQSVLPGGDLNPIKKGNKPTVRNIRRCYWTNWSVLFTKCSNR